MDITFSLNEESFLCQLYRSQPRQHPSPAPAPCGCSAHTAQTAPPAAPSQGPKHTAATACTVECALGDMRCTVHIVDHHNPESGTPRWQFTRCCKLSEPLQCNISVCVSSNPAPNHSCSETPHQPGFGWLCTCSDIQILCQLRWHCSSQTGVLPLVDNKVTHRLYIQRPQGQR